MKVYTTDKIRNIALISHATVGKTTLAEALLYASGAITRMGTIEDGTTQSDYHEDEIERQFSISTTLLNSEWKDRKINIIDTPGYPDFHGEVNGAMRAADTGIVLINAVAGVEVGTDAVYRTARERGAAIVWFVNRCDKEHADFNAAVTSISESFSTRAIPLQIPVQPGEAFSKIIDLLAMKLVSYDENGKSSVSEIPADLQAEAEAAREQLVEAVAECDDDLLEKFFDSGELSDDELRTGLRTGLAEEKISPVLCGAAAKGYGADLLLDFIADYCPAPDARGTITGTRPDSDEEVTFQCTSDASLAALVFKTMSERHLGELSFFRVFSGTLDAGTEVFNSSRNVTEKIGQIYVMNGKNRSDIAKLVAGDIGTAVKLKDTHTGDTLCSKSDPIVLPEIKFPEPVIRVALESKTKGDEDKIANGLSTLHEEDPSFIVTVDPELHQTILAGQGELHFDVIIKRLKEKYGVEVDLVEPKIPYRETIRGSSQGQSKYKKQSGGRGQYGDVHLKLEPMQRGEGFEFVDEIVGGVVPGKYIPAVEKGVREAMDQGVIAGYPVVDVRVRLYDGSYHSVDSSDMAFKIAASMGFRKLFKEANPVLLEPIYDVEVRVPEEFMGDVMGDISSRRGKIQGMEAEGQFQLIKAKVPLSELYKYSTKLRSLTQGKGLHRRKFSHYEEMPGDVQAKLVAEYEAAREQGS